MNDRLALASRVFRRGLLTIVPVATVLFSPLLLGDADARELYFGLVLVAFLAVPLVALLALIDGRE